MPPHPNATHGAGTQEGGVSRLQYATATHFSGPGRMKGIADLSGIWTQDIKTEHFVRLKASNVTWLERCPEEHSDDWKNTNTQVLFILTLITFVEQLIFQEFKLRSNSHQTTEED